MVEGEYMHPFDGMEQGVQEVCQTSFDSGWGVEEIHELLSSDTEVQDIFWNGELGELDEHETREVLIELRDGCRPRAEVLAGAGVTPEMRARFFVNDLECLVSKIGNNSADARAFESFLVAHFAAGGSSSCAAVNSRLEQLEEQFLADESQEEAEEDRECALQRLREGMQQYADVVRKVSRRTVNTPLLCSLVTCALSVACASLPPAAAYAVVYRQRRPHAAPLHQTRVRALCSGGVLRFLLHRMSAFARHLPPHNPRAIVKNCTSVAKRWSHRFATEAISMQAAANSLRWAARVEKGSPLSVTCCCVWHADVRDI